MPIKLVMGGVPFTVDEEKMPYFKAWASFKELQSPDAGDAPYHAPLEFFAAAHVGVEKGFRFIFRDTSLASELENYKRLVDTMKLLCIGVTNGLSLDNIIKKLKIITERDKHDTYCIRRGRIQDAQDAAFLFLWAILEGGTEMAPHRMANKIQVAVVFVMSHPKSFHFVIRRVLEAAYNSRFVSTPKQILQMNKWHDTTDSDCNYQSTDSNEEEGGYDSDGYYS